MVNKWKYTFSTMERHMEVRDRRKKSGYRLKVQPLARIEGRLCAMTGGNVWDWRTIPSEVHEAYDTWVESKVAKEILSE